jgi:hypothetical protein
MHKGFIVNILNLRIINRAIFCRYGKQQAKRRKKANTKLEEKVVVVKKSLTLKYIKCCFEGNVDKSSVFRRVFLKGIYEII